MGLYSHRPGYIVALVVCFIVFLVMLAFNGMAGAAVAPIFYNTTGAISDKYYLDITPAGATFSIWGVIYAWQCLWFGYAFSLVCRKGVDGYLYYSPILVPVWIFVIYIVNNGLNIGWLILWDRELLVPGVIIIALIPFSLFWCLFISAWALDKNLGELQQQGMMKEVWMIRFLVQNGWAFYLTWTAIATLLNLGMVCAYFGNLAVDVAGSISLAILTTEVVVWFCLDMFLLDRYVRYLFAPYLCLVWALSGVVSKNYFADGNFVINARNPIWEVVLLSVSCAALVIKIVVLIWRHFKRPLISVDMKETHGLQPNPGNGSIEPPISNEGYVEKLAT